jgi:hypothetical protein
VKLAVPERPAQNAPARAQRLHAYTVSAILLAVMAVPALRAPDDDGFPLSTYPMFAHRRGRTNDVTSAIAVFADGGELAIPPRYVANSETMQAFYRLSRAVAAGDEAASALCEEIARRLSTADDSRLRGARQVKLITESVDAIDYLAGRAKPAQRRTHASCKVMAGDGS